MRHYCRISYRVPLHLGNSIRIIINIIILYFCLFFCSLYRYERSLYGNYVVLQPKPVHARGIFFFATVARRGENFGRKPAKKKKKNGIKVAGRHGLWWGFTLLCSQSKKNNNIFFSYPLPIKTSSSSSVGAYNKW